MSETLELEKITNEFPEKIDGIKKALENLLTTEAKVAEYKKKYAGLTIIDRNDKDGYKIAREALSVLVKTRTSSEEDRKITLKPIDELRDNVHNRFKGVQDDLKEIESPVRSQVKEIDDIEEQEKAAKKLADEQKINDRINALLENGMYFENGFYIIKNEDLGVSETSIGVVDIRTMSDELFKNLLENVVHKNTYIIEQKFQAAKKEMEAEKIRLENDRKEREDFEKQKEELRLKQVEMEKQQEELRKQKEDADKKEQERLLEEKRIKAAADETRWRNRLALLDEIGWNGQFAFAKLGDNETQVFTYDELVELSEETFNQRKDDYNNSTAAYKKDIADKAEAKRLADIEKAKQDAIEEQKQKELQEKENEKIRLEQSTDKVKYENILAQIKAIIIPEFKSTIYKGKANIIRDFIYDLS